MKYKFSILLMISYLLAFSINFMPALKHPDSNMNIINLLATIFFLLVLLVFAKKQSNTEKENKILKIFSMFGVVSGVLLFLIKTFEDITFEYVILDIIASIQYPFYLIFTIPLFGANMLFDLSNTTFSLLMSLFYILVFILAVNIKKNDTQSA